MNIAVRLFAGYFLVVGLTAWFVLNTFSEEVEPGFRQATEDALVDTAALLAEAAAHDLREGIIRDGAFATAVERALQRAPDAVISGVNKDAVEMRIYLTDAHGRVVYDSAGKAVGADYSRWRDVAQVLAGHYGARSTREQGTDPASAVMYVAAPVLDHGSLIGVLSVAKPNAAMTPYLLRARDKLGALSLALLAGSVAIGLLFTLWLTWSLNRLRDYARAVAAGERARAPLSGGRQLSELAAALEQMRARLDGKQYVEAYVQSLAHELKSPLSAVRGAAELLREKPAEEDAQRFVRNIDEQTGRMQAIIERLLQLARIEQLQVPEHRQTMAVQELAATVIGARQDALARRALHCRCTGEAMVAVSGDRLLLEQALGNLIDNAIEFSPQGGEILVIVDADVGRVAITVRDQGPGAPDYALPQLFDKFYSLPRPATGRKSTGLGLPFVREVAQLHGGTVHFANCAPAGAEVVLRLPRA